MNQTMGRLQKMREDEYSGFLRVMFGLTSSSPVDESSSEIQAIEWIDPSLNESQKDAIRFALGSREVALIHGPPGVSFYCNSIGLNDTQVAFGAAFFKSSGLKRS